MRERTLNARIERERTRALTQIADRQSRPAEAWWLSFADNGFRGAVIVHAEDLTAAVIEANLHSVNPHGECQGMPIPADAAAQIPERWKYRILDRKECEEFDKEMLAALKFRRENQELRKVR